MWSIQPASSGWHWWKRTYQQKIKVSIVQVKKNWGNGKFYIYAGKRTEDCKGEWQPVQPPVE